ncbi:FKBP-type peptidyl-prolyl cis-trans isomerase [Nocardioides caldifontis]|uniref:FKBP-type peptidyl-prolyl cis-trans isomerase n=1 Tax=Nocardioides caldifontis TaxID=2588938 RepID=UPI0011DF3A0E|nr:FKBP-type peptidyl-prolyl cis-trans isomerase [Nocardioides caldifontis]
MRRRRLASALVAVLTLTGVAACGDDSSDGGSGSSSGGGSISGLTVSGDFAKEPKVEVDGLDVEEAETQSIIDGDGEELGDDGAAMTRIFIAKGSDGSKLASSYEDENPYKMVVAEQPPVIADAITGATIGSRIALAVPASELYGEQGNPQLGLAADDDVVVVFDLVEAVEPPLDGPEGKEVDPPADAPKADTDDDGNVVGIDFADAPKNPPAKLQVITLIEGEGPEVKEDDPVTVDYFGAVWDGKEAFDESYSRGTPASFQLSKGSLIDGWVQGLQGVPVGSRVMLVIPPKLGYGDQEQEAIPAGSTLVFVVDVLQAGS